jgi:hypothetical protein
MKPKRKMKDVRTSVSLAPVVWEWAGEIMEVKGFNNLSSYVADLIRRDKERIEGQDGRGSRSYTVKSAPTSQISFNETKDKDKTG